MVSPRAFKTQPGKGMIVAACSNMEEKLCILRAKKHFVATEVDVIKPNDLLQQDRVVLGRIRMIVKEGGQSGA